MQFTLTRTDLPKPAGSPLDILVVDDSRTNLQVMGRRLTHMGYRACLCASGTEALDRVQGRAFDLVILDMGMPGMCGMAVLREIRAMQPSQHLPVLMITERSDPAAVIEALAGGADDHLAKPFDFDVLAARMERLIQRARDSTELRSSNAALDARIAERAMEIGELRDKLTAMQADRKRLASSLFTLQAELDGR